MKKITLQSTIEEIMAGNPDTAEQFEKLGIDFCCGGKATLEVACVDRGLDPDSILDALTHATSKDTLSTGWERATGMSPTELTEHIEAVHHAKLWAEMDRLDALSAKVVKAHGAHDPRLAQLREVFLDLAGSLSEHMIREEKILFPLIRRIDAVGGPALSHCGSVANPIRAMEADHEEAMVAFLEMRQLADDFVPPPWACRTYAALLEGLEEMEADMGIHIREESELLFPTILRIETAS